VRPSRSESGSSIFIVRKADGSLCLCIDYRGLNEVPRKDAYPLPRADDTLNKSTCANFYTRRDLAFEFWQVRVREAHVLKPAFLNSDDLMEWVTRPIGMCNAPATFQRMMTEILVRDFVHNYVSLCPNNVCICCRTLEEQMENMRLTLQRFEEEGLKLPLKTFSLDYKRWSTLTTQFLAESFPSRQRKLRP
jgi:hypothetical protein